MVIVQAGLHTFAFSIAGNFVKKVPHAGGT